MERKKVPIGLSIQEMRKGINILQKRTVEQLYKEFEEKFGNKITTAKSLLSGTFYEINSKLKIILPHKIYELYEKKQHWIKIEKEIGLL